MHPGHGRDCLTLTQVSGPSGGDLDPGAPVGVKAPANLTQIDPPRPAPPPKAPLAMSIDAAAQFPESLRYRWKNKLLGPPLVSEQLSSERLSRPIALGVLAPDCLSSSAYGTEETLTQLVPAIGLAAFTLVVPIMIAILGVLFFVTLSYLEVIQRYTKAGGAYVVARDNFGPKIAQIAAVALLIDYTVTVAVQTAAGTDALTSAFPRLLPYTVPISVGVVLVLVYGNLRGIREAGKFFAFPTYFFVVSVAAVIVVGYVKAALGDLHAHALPPTRLLVDGRLGHSGSGLLMGLAFITLLRAFANGGSSLTGLEAISNGVGSFRRPESRNARRTLVTMSTTLAFLLVGVTLLARWTHAIPYAAGSPTVISQEVHDVLGTSGVGRALFYIVQAATLLVLYTGGNTSFNGFPYLASFVAGDQFLPRQLTRRGHRLAFSNGILVLAAVAITLLLVTEARVSSLVALYAIGVFSGFTMAGAGMVKHHLTNRDRHWRRSLAINGFAAFLSATVVLIFAVAKFTEGAWVVVVVGPILFVGLIRLHRRYVAEEQLLELGVTQATRAPILSRHVVVVLVDHFDIATARALQYARSLAPDDLRAVHFDIDSKDAHDLEEEWSRLGLSRIPLDIVECRDRRLTRAAVELAADAVASGDTECTVLLPRRSFRSAWQRLLHDRTADRIAAALSVVPNVAATIVPYNVGEIVSARAAGRRTVRTSEPVPPAPPPHRSHEASAIDQALARRSEGTVPIGSVQWRHRVSVAGRIQSVRVQPRGGTSNLECVLVDGTGRILLVFQGRPRIPGIENGARLVASGMVGSWDRRLALLNPDYELVASSPEAPGR
jgi:amino acid transporter